MELSNEVQGITLSAFYWGYCITPALMGILAHKLHGAKLLIGCCMFASAVVNLGMPVAAEFHYLALCVLRFVMGLLHGVYLSALQYILSTWLPPAERGFLMALAFSGETDSQFYDND